MRTSGRCAPGPAIHGPAGQRGFTLIELMISLTIIGILLAIAIPHFRLRVLDSRLDNALPILMQIAAKQRMYYLEKGQYCCNNSTFDEEKLSDGLGLSVNDTGDFCFAFVCTDSSRCESPTASGYIAPAESGDPTVEFEVWAVLRRDDVSTINAPNSTQCVMANDKPPPQGWVAAASDPNPGRQSQVVVLRYPPPPNGVDVATGNRGLRFSWNAGVSRTDALQP